jgi:hypothetical protein
MRPVGLGFADDSRVRGDELQCRTAEITARKFATLE